MWNWRAKIHTVLTDNGAHFTDPTGDGWTPNDIEKMQAATMIFPLKAGLVER